MVRSRAQIVAEKIIQRLQIRYPSEINIREIAMERGAFVKEGVLEGSEAMLVRKGSLGIITVNSRIPERGRTRFAIAHELGHFELHVNSRLILCVEEDMFVWNESETQEIEANEFAANILMPEEMFTLYTKKKPPSMDTVAELSREFRTTLTATSLRYVQLSKEPCALVISKDCYIKWYKKSPSFNFHLRVGEKLSFDTYAFDFYDGVDLPFKAQKVPADAWLADTYEANGEIVEHSIALESYNVVLSLLWIDKEIRSAQGRYDNDEGEEGFDLTHKFTPDGKRWRW